MGRGERERAARELIPLRLSNFPLQLALRTLHLALLRTSSWSVVALLGARGGVRLVGAHDDPPPGAVALRVARRVADHVLARELVGDLPVDAGQLVRGAREEHPAARLLRELAQHV